MRSAGRSPGVVRDERGVSEALSYVLIFALITSTVGVVYVVGMGGLTDARDYERVTNAERAFDVLADNLDDITHRRAPSRATEVKLADAGLRMGDAVTVNVTGERVSDPATNFSTEYWSRPIVYDANTGSTIVYVNGAVVRDDGSGAVMKQRPSFVLNGEEVVVPVVQTRAGGTDAVSGSSTVLIRTDHSRTDLVSATEGPYDVTLNVTSPRPDVWERYLEGHAGVDACTVESSSVVCEAGDVERVYVPVVRVDVAFE